MSDAPFDTLASGSDGDFYNTATELAAKLIQEMDHRMRPGLLIALRASAVEGVWAALLKLEVVTPDGAILRRLDRGEESLEAVKNVLDSPGELQKGAVFPDPRRADGVIIGDRLAVDAEYFPHAFGIGMEQRADQGTRDMVVEIAHRVGTPVALRAAVALPEMAAGTADEALGKLGERIAELDATARAEIGGALRGRKRPVVEVNPRAPVKMAVVAGGIRITGGPRQMEGVRFEQLPAGGWRITIDVDEEPKWEAR